ncbi:MAG: hypothetical protein WCT44_01990 [Candidatus Paceibacterota bacterium]
MTKEYIAYLKDNPERLWFKRKMYGWGWVPVRWQGWAVVLVGIAIALLGIRIGDADDSPGAALLGVLLMVALIFYFGYKKGEKPKWMWGPPKDKI